MSDQPPDLEAARAAKAELLDELAGVEGIAGVGIAPAPGGGYELKVDLRTDDASWVLPAEVSGVPVRTEVVGDIRPL